MATELQRLIEAKQFPSNEIAAKSREIYDRLLRDSEYLDAGNFTVFHPDDLKAMLVLYDRLFFSGQCQDLLGDTPLHFRISKRMTSAGGMTARKQFRGVRGTEYEISISSPLLFQTFHGVNRPITVSGIRCFDRLQAMQRLFEHELIHLIEMLIWTRSNCAAPRFQSIASRFFGHTDHTHHLITPLEQAFTKFGIQPGDRVSFQLDGKRFVGFVNRITKRATVLVEDARGRRYSDGKRYAKFYVPLAMLERVGR